MGTCCPLDGAQGCTDMVLKAVAVVGVEGFTVVVIGYWIALDVEVPNAVVEAAAQLGSAGKSATA